MPIKRRIRTRRIRQRLCQSLHLSRDELRAIDRDLRRRTRWRIMLPLLLMNSMIVGGLMMLVASGAIIIPAITSQGLLVLVVTRMLVLAAIVFMYVRFVFLPVLERLTQPDLLRVVRERGHNICTACGYNLAGRPCESSACPECGSVTAAS